MTRDGDTRARNTRGNVLVIGRRAGRHHRRDPAARRRRRRHPAEARARLGGATHSFRRGDLIIDNGQHVFLRCCTAYRALLDRLGVTGSVTLQDRFDVTVLRPGGQARLRRSRAARPAAPGPARWPLPAAQPGRAAAGGPGRAGPAVARPGRPGLDAQRSATGWRAHGQDEQARRGAVGPVQRLRAERRRRRRRLAWPRSCSRPRLLAGRTPPTSAVPVPLGELHGQAAGRRWPGSAPRCGCAPRPCPSSRPRSAGDPGPGGRGDTPTAPRRRQAAPSARPMRTTQLPAAEAASSPPTPWSSPCRRTRPPGWPPPQLAGAARGLSSASRRSSTCTWSTTGG